MADEISTIMTIPSEELAAERAILQCFQRHLENKDPEFLRLMAFINYGHTELDPRCSAQLAIAEDFRKEQEAANGN